MRHCDAHLHTLLVSHCDAHLHTNRHSHNSANILAIVRAVLVSCFFLTLSSSRPSVPLVTVLSILPVPPLLTVASPCDKTATGERLVFFQYKK